MQFLLERDNPVMQTEYHLWKQMLSESPQHTFREMSMEELTHLDIDTVLTAIPLGSIPFTEKHLSDQYGIPQLFPVEIPPCLRIPEFLGRSYRIIPGSEVPDSGRWFVKDANGLKRMTFLGDCSALDRTKLDPNGWYVVSEPMEVLAEYRVYVLEGKIYAVEYYNGTPLYFPDAEKIRKINALYGLRPDYPKSYSFDIMVTPNGTFLVEVHPTLFALGLYTTVLGADWMEGYRDSMEYVLKYNVPITIARDRKPPLFRV